MSYLTLRPEQMQQIQSHAERTYPEECCGLLLGKIERQTGTAQKQLMSVVELPNAWNEAVAAELQDAVAIDSSRHPSATARRDRYWIEPQDLLKTQRDARDQGLIIIGIYHSHPDHPAVPSEMDRVLAWAEYSYLIVSVEQGIVTAVGCWLLDRQHQFQAEEFRVEEGNRFPENLPLEP